MYATAACQQTAVNFTHSGTGNHWIVTRVYFTSTIYWPRRCSMQYHTDSCNCIVATVNIRYNTVLTSYYCVFGNTKQLLASYIFFSVINNNSVAGYYWICNSQRKMARCFIAVLFTMRINSYIARHYWQPCHLSAVDGNRLAGSTRVREFTTGDWLNLLFRVLQRIPW